MVPGRRSCAKPASRRPCQQPRRPGGRRRPFPQAGGVDPLVLAIEDLHEADPDSLAAYAMLAKAARPTSILLLATLDPAHPNAARPALRLLRDGCLRSSCGRSTRRRRTRSWWACSGRWLRRRGLATFLQNHAAGNPRAYTEVIHHLIAQGFIRYAEGTWILPDELPRGSRRRRARRARERGVRKPHPGWSPALRALAMCLSPQRRCSTSSSVARSPKASPSSKARACRSCWRSSCARGCSWKTAASTRLRARASENAL